MAEMNMTGGRTNKRGGRRTNPKVDLTPMVDLGFLLITFFMLTATLKRDYLVDVKLPVPGPPKEVPASVSMTLVMGGGDKYYYYLGQDADKIDSVNSAKDLRKVLARHNAPLLDSINRLERLLARKEITDTVFKNELDRISKENWALNVLVKAKDNSNCQQMVSTLEQLHGARVSKYALVDMEDKDRLAMGR